MDIKEETVFLSARVPINWEGLSIFDALLPSLKSKRIGWARVFANGDECVTLPSWDTLRAESQLGARLDGGSVRLWVHWGSESKVANGRLGVSDVLEYIGLRRRVIGEGVVQFLLSQKLDGVRIVIGLVEA